MLCFSYWAEFRNIAEVYCILEDVGPLRDFLLMGRKGIGSGSVTRGMLNLGSLPHLPECWDFRHLLPGEEGAGVL